MEVTKELIETNWPLTRVTIGPMPSQGMGGTVGIVQANEGKYTYKIAGSWKNANSLNRDLGAFDFLHNYGFKHIPSLLKTKNRSGFIEFGDQLIYLLSFIEGKRPEATPEIYKQIGEITSELHLVKNFPFESDLLPANVIPDLVKNAERHSFRNEYIEILKKLPDFQKYPKTLIHTDLSIGNFIQRPSGELYIIDWDEIGIGPTVLDLGVPLLNDFVTENLEVKEENARAYYETYLLKKSISEEEKEGIYYAALFWLCMYIQYGDNFKRWNRIKWALENKDKLMSWYTS